jgi:predicted ester cyclase
MPTAAEERAAESPRGDAAAIGTAYFAAVAARDADAMAALWEPGGIGEIHGLVTLRAPDDVRRWFGETFAAMPDLRMEVLEVIATGEKAAVHWHLTGTFTGPGKFQGMLPTGAVVDLTGCDVLTVVAGTIRRNDAYMNGAQMAQQLGALPPTGSVQERAMIGALNLKTRAAKRLGR